MTKTKLVEHYQDLAIQAAVDAELRTVALTLDPALHHALLDYSTDNGITRETAIREILKHVLTN